MLVLSVAEDFDKLLKYCRLAPIALLCKLSGVVVVAIDLPIVLIVAVLRAKNGGTERACEMVDMVLPFQGCDVRSPEGATTLVAEQTESAKVIGLAKGILALAIFVVGWEELGGNDLTAILDKALRN